MGFEVYIRFFGETERVGLPRDSIRSLFPVIEEESEPDYWQIRYDNKNSCKIGVTSRESDRGMLKGMYVDRPCGDLRLWEGLLSIVRMGAVVMFWPGGPPVIASQDVAAGLPVDMIDSIGAPRVANSVADILGMLKES
jgi:hypothetical protein